jgi:hypothetical protein
VTGAKVADNSLTGADVDESTLGPVPQAFDASELGGVGADEYGGRTEALTGDGAGGLTPINGATTTIVEKNVPAGAYVVLAQLTVGNGDESNPSDVECALRSDAVPALADVASVHLAANQVGVPIRLMATGTASSPTSLAVSCTKVGGLPTAEQAHLVAIKVDGIK